MVPQLTRGSAKSSISTPVGVAARGIAGGIAGTLLLSVLSRVLPAMRAGPPRTESSKPDGPPAMTPANALTIAHSPGPEGLAEQFAFKVASGVFGRDVGDTTRMWGLVVHFVYGATWGMLYGLFQASYRQRPSLVGPLYGLVVWLTGPAILVPSMGLLGKPSEESPMRTGSLVASHVAYGLTLATTFETLQRKT